MRWLTFSRDQLHRRALNAAWGVALGRKHSSEGTIRDAGETTWQILIAVEDAGFFGLATRLLGRTAADRKLILEHWQVARKIQQLIYAEPSAQRIETLETLLEEASYCRECAEVGQADFLATTRVFRRLGALRIDTRRVAKLIRTGELEISSDGKICCRRAGYHSKQAATAWLTYGAFLVGFSAVLFACPCFKWSFGGALSWVTVGLVTLYWVGAGPWKLAKFCESVLQAEALARTRIV
jgi:hypothetical protein